MNARERASIRKQRRFQGLRRG